MPLRFRLNDRWVDAGELSPTLTLLRFLRDRAHLTATKEGCAEGDCGACCVAILEHDSQGKATWRSVNSCLVLLPMVQGKSVYTAEGIGKANAPHLVQSVLAEKLGSQCGYCTPGVVMSLFEACYRADMDEAWKSDAQMCGNLCRCTGYRPIREACESVQGARPNDAFAKALENTPRASMALEHSHGAQTFYTPESLPALWALLDKNPSARFVAGGTDLSLEVTKRFAEPPLLISLEGVPDLRGLSEEAQGFHIGATVTLTELEAWAKDRLPPLERMLRYFGSRPIKNRATLGGNLCNASPIGDMPPVFIALGAQAVLRSRSGERRVPLEDFFIAYRKTALKPGEVLAGLEVPRLTARTLASSYKVSKRRELDISAVACAFKVHVGADGKVSEARLAYGGMAATPARARKTEAALVGAAWNTASVDQAVALLEQDFTPLSDHRASAWYRMNVAKNLLRGFFEETKSQPQPRLSDAQTGTVAT
jgi:xanthine dehydrogenase small subunit